MLKASATLPFLLLVSGCFSDSEHKGLSLTDGWISGTDFQPCGGLALPFKRFLVSSSTMFWSQTSKAQIPPNNGLDCNNDALLSSAPWPANTLSLQAWNFYKQRKTKRSKARVLYYSNSTASFQILLRSGDIALNPGPVKCDSGNQGTRCKQRSSRNAHRDPTSLKCDNCEKTIRKNQKSVACEVCFSQQHIKCTDLGAKYIGTTWTCPKCLSSILPFFNYPYHDTLEDFDPAEDTNSLHLVETLKNHSKDLSIMHFNTQSMVSSFNEFQVLVSQLPMDIITMSETWLRNNPALLDYVTLPGYTALFRNREGARGGGVGAYISNSIQFKRRKDIEQLQPEMEHLWIEVPGRNKHSKALIGVIYRSERIGLSPPDWLDAFETLLAHLTASWDGLLLLTGDTNIDMLNPSNRLTKQYQSILDAFGCHQHVTKATRITQTSKTLIDHIVSNNRRCITATEVIPGWSISDHEGIFACVNVRVIRYQPRYKWIRLEKELIAEEFVKDCANLPLNVVYGLDSPDDMVQGFNTLFGECIDRHAPLKRIKVTRPPAPWMNSDEVRKLQAERDKLRQDAHKENSDDGSWVAFRAVRNKIKSVINKSRRAFITNALSSKRPKEVWRVIHRILHPSPKPLQADPDRLNNYFIKTNERTLGTKPDERSDLIDLVNSFSECPRTSHPFHLRSVSLQEVEKEIDNLRSDTSTGIDQIPVKFVKLAKEHISGPLTHIINHCIVTSSFPRLWKIARISPIPKVNEPLSDADYRPVSILPTLSKVFERLVLNQLVVFINEEALLGPTVSGFRKGHSTTTVLLGIRDALIRASSRGEVTLMVCADYSKAFDTVKFRSVVSKMHSLGFSKDFLLWMIDYLTHRRQLVQIDDKKSDMATVEFGVPQGSILGPVIFNLYVADLQSELQCDCYQYADDTTFYVHSKPCDLDASADHINRTITRLRHYSESCNLALNPSKTNWMLVSSPQMARYHNLEERNLPVACGDTPLERISCAKLLGVYMDQHLTWKSHVDHVLSSSYGTLSVLRRLKNLAPFHVRKHLAESLVLSKVHYACSVFHPLPAFQMKRLQRLQNACAGFVMRRFAGLEDVIKLKWLPVKENVELNILKLTHKSLYDEAFPEYLNLHLHKVSAYNLRSTVAPVLSIPRESGTFQHSAATIFNKLPATIRNTTEYVAFCRSVRSHLLATLNLS